MIANTTIYSPIDYSLIWVICSFFLSAAVSYSSYPIIIKISKLKELMQEPGSRCSHIIKTPNLGGIGIFLGIISALTFIGSILSYNNLLCLIGALVVLFFTGIKDDLVGLIPKHKLVGQVMASLCVITITDIRIYSFFGIFGLEILPYVVSVIFTLFVFILIINAFNLIDGVDGLAGSIGITCSILFGLFYYFNGNDSMLFISLSLIGALSTFLIFNFSKTKKVFMGDTGSMIVGFLLAYQGVSFLRVDHSVELFSAISNPPALVIAIFSFPLMDTLRVFIIRILQRRSPFSADRGHIHHNLLALGFKHWEISLIGSVFVLAIASMTYIFNDINLYASILSIITVSFVCSVTPYIILKIRQNSKTAVNTINKSNSMVIFNYLNKRPKYSFEIKKVYSTILNIFISIVIYFKM